LSELGFFALAGPSLPFDDEPMVPGGNGLLARAPPTLEDGPMGSFLAGGIWVVFVVAGASLAFDDEPIATGANWLLARVPPTLEDGPRGLFPAGGVFVVFVVSASTV